MSLDLRPAQGVEPTRRAICDECDVARHYACDSAWCQCGCEPAAALQAALALACDCLPRLCVRCDRCTARAYLARQGPAERTYDALRAEILTYGCHVDTPAWSYCWYCGATAGRGRPTAHAPDCLWSRLTQECEAQKGDG